MNNKDRNQFCNIPKSIDDKITRKLHLQKNHPIEIIKNQIYAYFKKTGNYEMFDDLDSVVTVEDNFDKLLIPENHPSRKKTDTYYINEKYVLRTHTSAHQNELLKQGHTNFLVVGDVFRKDEIDSRHFPVFHQLELVSIIEDDKDPSDELKKVLSGLIEHLFPKCEYRFNEDYFPFTHPSYEIEVKYNNNWLEILGCGVMQPKILENNGIINKKGIACGMGLERLVMIMCGINDIRYLWSVHDKFINQFSNGKLNQFQPYSELPNQTRDISFYIHDKDLEVIDKFKNTKWNYENDFFEILRDNSHDMMEEVKLIDSFYNKKSNKYSKTYRLLYSPNDPELKDPGMFFDMINNIQNNIRKQLTEKLNIELR